MRSRFNQFIFNRYKKNEVQLHELNYLFWESTLRCNLNCLHCGSDCSADSNAKDMPFDDFLKAILPLKNVYKSDSITVAITGGEALLREDLPQCGIELRKNGFRWGIVTNGYNYTQDIHGRLLAAGMGSITVSLDGFETSHNWLRNNGQSFSRAVNAINLITSTKRLNYDIVTCVNKKNIHELEALKEFLVTQNVKAWRLFTISPLGRAANNEDLFLNCEQLQQLLDFIVCCRNDKRINVYFSCGAYTGKYEKKVRDNFFFCRAGSHIASVLIDGSISACPNINRGFVQGSIYHDSFLDVWNKRFDVMRNRKWTKTGICKNCDEYKNCGGGPMHLWDEKKDSIKACVYAQINKK